MLFRSTGWDGRIETAIGGPEPGDADGSFEAARFYRPQGLAMDGDVLYIADTENHLVRAANLVTRQVSRIAGTGRQGRWGDPGGRADETPFSSPWDLALHGRLLFVAMAGVHQVWLVDLDRELAIPYAGSGREARVDGSVEDAAFAQPSGLARDRGSLYVADGESNIIREVALPPVNQVKTLAGGDLFDFGDADGIGDAVRLQHPLGVSCAAGKVFIADTYNHRLKVMDPATRRVRSFAGTGEPGHRDGPAREAQFYEPGGLCATEQTIFVADTNNHAIRAIGLADGAVRTLTIC